ncbi:hypothetical protein FEM48_Zijuj01G0152500 [Ziziphus jujuba var. spinosa]|uniref:Uncharacterized protein n=1 Tax=Ziziphus jujuba var. spinosa TaxID=714518 RepID=A0A978W203_ZIZJJ|nr:hypothetical protein FEM48_Zijuj01G0152500 [Ziziphus jujuba var. spinosa]
MTWDMKMAMKMRAPLQLISRLDTGSRHILGATNEGKLWEALLEGHIDMLSSDHFPTSPELKFLDNGDFLRAWGGISSLQDKFTMQIRLKRIPPKVKRQDNLERSIGEEVLDIAEEGVESSEAF